MFGALRDDVAALAVRERVARARAARSKARLDGAKARFLANPVNLLLPYTAGALGGALALYRKPGRARRGRRDERVAWPALLKTATTLWGLSLPLREALLDARAAAVADSAEASSPPATPTPAPSSPAPRRDARRATPRSDAPPARQPMPPA